MVNNEGVTASSPVPAASTAAANPRPAYSVLSSNEWQAGRDAHRTLVDGLLRGHQQRRQAGESHPVEDFLFDYYRLRPAQLRQWHPGAKFGLLDAPEYAKLRFYQTNSVGVSSVDVAAVRLQRAETVALAERILNSSSGATPQFGCFGLHEWAMVHQQNAQRRHSSWPLRLGAAGTDAVVQSHQLRCSHFDAFRFFTPSAKPLNLLQPTVWSRVELEQPGCLHANMDLYKWAYKLLPVTSSELVTDCFRLAREIRGIDMRASPYDLSAIGYSPIPVETSEGKADYVAAQRQFAHRAAELRIRLIAEMAPLIEAPESFPTSEP